MKIVIFDENGGFGRVEGVLAEEALVEVDGGLASSGRVAVGLLLLTPLGHVIKLSQRDRLRSRGGRGAKRGREEGKVTTSPNLLRSEGGQNPPSVAPFLHSLACHSQWSPPR